VEAASRQGLTTTFDVLARTENDAAVGVLVPALDSKLPRIATESLRCILRRRSPRGASEVIGRLHQAPVHWKEILAEYQGRITAALRAAILSPDPQFCANGCQAVLWFGEYDLMPALVNAAEDATNPNAHKAAATLTELADLLYTELAAGRDYSKRRDPQLVRRHVAGCLEASLRRYADHRRTEIVEAMLMIAHRDNAMVKQLLKNPHHAAYLPLIDTLTKSQRPGVLRLLLSYLEDAAAPSAAMGVIAHRTDERFLKLLFAKIGQEPSAHAKANLRRVTNIAWLSQPQIVEELDDAEQHGAVQMAMASGAKRLQVFPLIARLLRLGKPGGRRAAAEALAEFSGKDANQLCLSALQDPDPQVQASALAQLRPRGIPGAVTRLIGMLDSRHELVREAARESLAEFSFARYISSFDMLDDNVRESTGKLVLKIDPDAIGGLRGEISAQARSRRMRGIEAVIAMGVASHLEEELIAALADDDHMIRSRAALALGSCRSTRAQSALLGALSDRSEAVRQCAQESLEQFA